MRYTFLISLLIFSAVANTGWAQTAVAQVDAAERRENLKTCLSGQFPVLCKHQLLDATEKQQVDAAERRENLKTCLSGQFPVLCKHQLLNATEGQQVGASEQRENLKTCLSGQFPVLCKHQLLDATEKQQVEEAERRENLKTCLSGQFPVLCNHAMLNSSQESEIPAEPARVAVEVTSSPSPAEIEIDGRFVGSTRSVLGLIEGAHRIVITKPGFSPWSRTVDVAADSEVKIHADLQPAKQ